MKSQAKEEKERREVLLSQFDFPVILRTEVVRVDHEEADDSICLSSYSKMRLPLESTRLHHFD